MKIINFVKLKFNMRAGAMYDFRDTATAEYDSNLHFFKEIQPAAGAN